MRIRRFWTLVPVPIFCVLPISTRTLRLAHLLEQGVLLGVGVGVADDGDFARGGCRGDQLLDDLVVDGVTPGVGFTPMSQNTICVPRCGAVCFQMAVMFSDQGVDLRAGAVLRRAGQHPGDRAPACGRRW